MTTLEDFKLEITYSVTIQYNAYPGDGFSEWRYEDWPNGIKVYRNPINQEKIYFKIGYKNYELYNQAMILIGKPERQLYPIFFGIAGAICRVRGIFH